MAALRAAVIVEPVEVAIPAAVVHALLVRLLPPSSKSISGVREAHAHQPQLHGSHATYGFRRETSKSAIMHLYFEASRPNSARAASLHAMTLEVGYACNRLQVSVTTDDAKSMFPVRGAACVREVYTARAAYRFRWCRPRGGFRCERRTVASQHHARRQANWHRHEYRPDRLV
jgi:hypothetical protein